jgi:hypothetical protein
MIGDPAYERLVRRLETQEQHMKMLFERATLLAGDVAALRAEKVLKGELFQYEIPPAQYVESGAGRVRLPWDWIDYTLGTRLLRMRKGYAEHVDDKGMIFIEPEAWSVDADGWLGVTLPAFAQGAVSIVYAAIFMPLDPGAEMQVGAMIESEFEALDVSATMYWRLWRVTVDANNAVVARERYRAQNLDTTGVMRRRLAS